jgi:hypothetical protein
MVLIGNITEGWKDLTNKNTLAYLYRALLMEETYKVDWKYYSVLCNCHIRQFWKKEKIKLSICL